MKTVIIVLIILALLVGSFFAYRAFIPPSFSIESLDNLTKSGRFIFSGSENSFGPDKSGSASGYSGWVVTYGNKDGQYSFDLYRNGKFIKNLQTL